MKDIDLYIERLITLQGRMQFENSEGEVHVYRSKGDIRRERRKDGLEIVQLRAGNERRENKIYLHDSKVYASYGTKGKYPFEEELYIAGGWEIAFEKASENMEVQTRLFR